MSFIAFVQIVKVIQHHLAFDVFHTGQGVQGLQKRPSKQQLDTVFGTHRDDEVVEYILKNGKPQHGDLDSSTGSYVMEKSNMPTRNIARGSATIDNKGGKRLSGI